MRFNQFWNCIASLFTIICILWIFTIYVIITIQIDIFKEYITRKYYSDNLNDCYFSSIILIFCFHFVGKLSSCQSWKYKYLCPKSYAYHQMIVLHIINWLTLMLLCNMTIFFFYFCEIIQSAVES